MMIPTAAKRSITTSVHRMPQLSFNSGRIHPHACRNFGSTRAKRRDNPLPPLTNPVEQAIETSRRRGELDNLTGAGKPLAVRDTTPTIPVGMSSSELLSKKAEFEMRRAIHNKELEEVAGMGEKLKYKGTTEGGIASVQGGGRTSDGGVSDTMSHYILKESDLSVKDLKDK